MLITPPPGYAPSAINRQTVPGLGAPGPQGLVPQGYTSSQPAGSLLPSSYAAPSSTNPNPQQPQAIPGMHGMPGMAPTSTGSAFGNPLGAHNIGAVVSALGGGRQQPSAPRMPQGFQ